MMLVVVALRLCPCLLRPGHMVDLHSLNRWGRDLGPLLLSSTGQEGLFSSLLFFYKETKDIKGIQEPGARL